MSMQPRLSLPRTEQIRADSHNTILILIPSANPDGVDIVADWYRRTLGTPYEGKEPPELYHHYAGHDDNRDWFMINLKETAAITTLFWKEWFPQIVYDIHQQGTTGSRFFIPPFYDPSNPQIPPLLLRGVGLIGHKVAADLQAAGFRGVITNALYDTWWHGGLHRPYFHNWWDSLRSRERRLCRHRVTRDQLSMATSPECSRATASQTFQTLARGVWDRATSWRWDTASRLSSLAAKYRSRYLRNF